MRLWPSSLFGRLALLLVGVLALALATTIFVFRQDRAALLLRHFGDTKIVQLQGVRAALEGMSLEDRREQLGRLARRYAVRIVPADEREPSGFTSRGWRPGRGPRGPGAGDAAVGSRRRGPRSPRAGRGLRRTCCTRRRCGERVPGQPARCVRGCARATRSALHRSARPRHRDARAGAHADAMGAAARRQRHLLDRLSAAAASRRRWRTVARVDHQRRACARADHRRVHLRALSCGAVASARVRGRARRSRRDAATAAGERALGDRGGQPRLQHDALRTCARSSTTARCCLRACRTTCAHRLHACGSASSWRTPIRRRARG